MVKMSIGNWLRVVLGGLLVLAAAVLVALQWHNDAVVTLYGPAVKVNVAVLMLCCAAGGILMWVVLGGFFRGLAALRRARKAAPPPT